MREGAGCGAWAWLSDASHGNEAAMTSASVVEQVRNSASAGWLGPRGFARSAKSAAGLPLLPWSTTSSRSRWAERTMT